MEKNLLAPGFLFRPTDSELVNYYLKRKVLGKELWVEAIAEVNIYKYAPWDLPDISYIKNGDTGKWYFFCPVVKKYASGMRSIRATEFGYWKVTGKDCPIYHNKEVSGKMKTLVFHQVKAGREIKPVWVMHEYRLEDKDLADSYVLCVVFKDGPVTHNEVPLREVEWSDLLAIFSSAEPSSDDSILSMLAIFTEDEPMEDGALVDADASDSTDASSAESSLSDDSILSMLAIFTEDEPMEDGLLEVADASDDSTNAASAESSLSDDSILSMVAIFTEDEPMEDGLLAVADASDASTNASSSVESGSDGTVLSMLAIFTEVEPILEDGPLVVADASDCTSASSLAAPDEDDIVSMLANFI